MAQPQNRPRDASRAHELISLAQKVARDSERHAILSASLATQADRLMAAGLKLLQDRVSDLDKAN